ncbi:MAG: RHS repeat-associated core domain-containing protein [Clostridia bacterium]|nr:RHS repeat-associated core domain-containing protein [Clostridia bacterium]
MEHRDQGIEPSATLIRLYSSGGASQELYRAQGIDNEGRGKPARYARSDDGGIRVSGFPDNSYGTEFLFTGRRLDSETGLYYYRNRYYNPNLGRFIQQDPLGPIDGPNVYTYVNNNPVNLIDPLGLCGDDDWGDEDWWNDDWWEEEEDDIQASVYVGYREITNVSFPGGPGIHANMTFYHTYIQVNYDTSVFAYGFNPVGGYVQRAFLNLDVPGLVDSEIPRFTANDIRVLVSNDVDIAESVLYFIQRTIPLFSQYNLYSQNCFHWRDTVLAFAGVGAINDSPINIR